MDVLSPGRAWRTEKGRSLSLSQGENLREEVSPEESELCILEGWALPNGDIGAVEPQRGTDDDPRSWLKMRLK